MTLGEKITRKRKESNLTQEQLAGVLGVSRQSISKWESDVTYPETDKLVRMSEMFDCSLDYLLKKTVEEESKENEKSDHKTILIEIPVYERKSERTLWGMPLWHVAKKARGVIAIGVNAKGIIAIGCKAQGIISVGVLSLGVISLGTISFGLLALGMFAMGLLAAGCFAIGIVAAGAICLGALSLGAIAIGDFSIGALAIGKYFAMGDQARADIAIGKTKAVGEAFEKIGDLSKQEIMLVRSLLDQKVPSYLSWIKEIVKLFL
ncbi:MAG TPA: helix-turn-helix transcriptional regulator [Lachnospiraceae bacterium]|nr:helix-turn-helix transcriptional regulator [Lachnospiraceae bacterium]